MKRAVLALVAACGGSGGEPVVPAPPRTAPAALVATPAAGDVVVATVAGRPVYGSCVAAQAARGHLDRRAALDECIAFELLAQAAEIRGAQHAGEVAEATRRALVSRLVETDFERRIRGPEDLPVQIEAAFSEVKAYLNRPELRASQYVRVKVDDKVPDAVAAKARAVADRIHAALADETGLFSTNVEEVAHRLGDNQGFELEINRIRPSPAAALVPPYAKALFEIPEVGRVSPVFRTAWGWDFTLLEQVIPARLFTRDEVVRDLFPKVQRAAFVAWCDQLRTQLGVRVEENVAALGGP